MSNTIKLELTSFHTKEKIYLVGSDWYVSTLVQDKKERTVVQNGMSNNGGFHVTESYEEIKDMIRRQTEYTPLTKGKGYYINNTKT